jgi:uncharacterized protein YjbI with pentapeptide repeats
MANREHVSKLRKGVKAWNRWRKQHPKVAPNLAGARLSGLVLTGANLRKADLQNAHLEEVNLDLADISDASLKGANLWGARVTRANLQGSDLSRTQLSGADFSGTDLRRAELSLAYCRNATFARANLTSAYLGGAVFSEASLYRANLTRAGLGGAVFLNTDLRGAKLTGCDVYGVSAWDVNLGGALQKDLVITPRDQPEIQVDNLEVAQFIYLLLNNQKIRHVIDTITSKVVLILGRFTPERKAVLDAIREKLRQCDRLPIMFDFEKPMNRTTEETVSTLAHMARFVIADLTDAKSVLQELRSIVPNSPSVIVQPLLLVSQEEPGMFDFFRKFPSVLEPFRYSNQKTLIAGLEATVIAPPEAKANSLEVGP